MMVKKALGMIWKHRSGDHSDCSDYDWCPSVTGVGNADQHRLPDFVCKGIKPIFTDLASDSLLHTWRNSERSERCPKTAFVGRRRLELAVYEATIVYNEGEMARMPVFSKLGFQPGCYTASGLKELDEKRVARAYVAGSATVLAQRQRRRCSRPVIQSA